MTIIDKNSYAMYRGMSCKKTKSVKSGTSECHTGLQACNPTGLSRGLMLMQRESNGVRCGIST